MDLKIRFKKRKNKGRKGPTTKEREKLYMTRLKYTFDTSKYQKKKRDKWHKIN